MKVVCVGMGGKGEGCGPVDGVSGGVCKRCGGMLLSKAVVKKADALAKVWDKEVLMARCQIEDCDAPHCKKCGEHYDPAFNKGGVCEDCLLVEACERAAHQMSAASVNYEELNRIQGW